MCGEPSGASEPSPNVAPSGYLLRRTSRMNLSRYELQWTSCYQKALDIGF